MLKPLLVLDFDGTVCLGLAPVERYADEVALRCPADLARVVRRRYAAWVDGNTDDPDGYFAVARAVDGALSKEQMSQAYIASRTWLAEHPETVCPPEGLVDFLAALGARGIQRVLFTNAPHVGVDEVLAHHGLDVVLDRVICDAGKPGGWRDHHDELWEGRVPYDVVSVGDVWANDCAPAMVLGARAFLIDSSGQFDAGDAVVGPDFPSLYSAIATELHV